MNKQSFLRKRSIQAIFIIWIISIIISFYIIVRMYIQYRSLKFTELIIFNGYALIFIICLCIPSFIKYIMLESASNLTQYDANVYVICTIIQWIVAFFATITIIIIYGIGNFSENIFIEFYYVFFLFIIWAALADIFIFYIGEYLIYIIGIIISESLG